MSGKDAIDATFILRSHEECIAVYMKVYMYFFMKTNGLGYETAEFQR